MAWTVSLYTTETENKTHLERVYIRTKAPQPDLLNLASIDKVWIRISPSRRNGHILRLVRICQQRECTCFMSLITRIRQAGFCLHSSSSNGKKVVVEVICFMIC